MLRRREFLGNKTRTMFERLPSVLLLLLIEYLDFTSGCLFNCVSKSLRNCKPCSEFLIANTLKKLKGALRNKRFDQTKLVSLITDKVSDDVSLEGCTSLVDVTTRRFFQGLLTAPRLTRLYLTGPKADLSQIDFDIRALTHKVDSSRGRATLRNRYVEAISTNACCLTIDSNKTPKLTKLYWYPVSEDGKTSYLDLSEGWSLRHIKVFAKGKFSIGLRNRSPMLYDYRDRLIEIISDEAEVLRIDMEVYRYYTIDKSQVGKIINRRMSL